MVKIALFLKANLDSIEELKPLGPDFQWCLKFKCSNCDEVLEKWQYMSLSVFTRSPRGNMVNHFVSKCKLCHRENSMTILEDTIQSYTIDDNGEFKQMVVFDCRGIEPIDFSPGEGWYARAVSEGKEFEDVDLSEGEWADYCDKTKTPCGIFEIEHKFEKVK
ncbi:UPF0587 protein C1orf123 homolog [Cephus cinctus]|uniref:UPF0587 protein C1orf123 homolog n=1 Tax=Cephus cinctus TaxID=211228 RepID=A0AAJ7FE53_CEPCN|nr:UPF0587 protein C1orf123 homolog [Cephus cinctus]XP_015587325.1 UPF0587 protein C1orf123 homolog [Cephus cinctus]XP_015587326.1 UPF0587 protein C1orf123 homolog [Cephus cinctus]